MFSKSFSPISVNLDRWALERALACEDGSAGRMVMDASAVVLAGFNFPDLSALHEDTIMRAIWDACKQDPAVYLSVAVSNLSRGKVMLTECTRDECGVHILGWSLPLRLQRGNEIRYLALTHSEFLTPPKA